jgi:hypothetical protein
LTPCTPIWPGRLRATHANGCISLEVRHLGERCTSCRKTGNGGRKGAASCSTPRCRSALSHASWPRRTKRTRCWIKHEPCFVSQRFDGDPLSFERGVASVIPADPPLHREALAFPTPCCPFSHGAVSRRSVIPAKTLPDLESTPGVTSSICTRPTDREHTIARSAMKELSLRPALPVSVLWEHDLQECLLIIVICIMWSVS